MLATGHLQAITVGFTNSSGTFSEAAGYGDFTLTLSEACGGCLIGVQFSGTATASNGGNNATGGDDYDRLYNRAGLTQEENSEQEQGQSSDGTGSVVIYTYGLGTTLTVSLDIENDTRYEGGASATDEYVTFMVYVVSGATVSGNQFYQFNIEDDDAVPVLSFTTETSVMDEYGDDTESFEYIRIEPSGVSDVGLDATVTWVLTDVTTSTADHHYTNSYTVAASGTMTLTESNNYTTFAYRSTNDGNDEVNETFTLTFNTDASTYSNCAVTGGTYTTHTHTINDDDDAESVYFSAASQEVSESVGTAVSYTHLTLPTKA